MTATPDKTDEKAAKPGFSSELTPEGEQLVIPGCEKRATTKQPQLDLFG